MPKTIASDLADIGSLLPWPWPFFAAGARAADGGGGLGSILGAAAVVLVAINTFGGFLVTERMLEMFKKKEPRK